jgi:hypothetical protein
LGGKLISRCYLHRLVALVQIQSQVLTGGYFMTLFRLFHCMIMSGFTLYCLANLERVSPFLISCRKSFAPFSAEA